MLIIHIIARDKFTNGYIKFMISQFSRIEHRFFTKKNAQYLIDADYPYIYEYTDNGKSLSQHLQLFNSADKIIVSGVWLSRELLLAFLFRPKVTPHILKKTYFHFWGGDFYSYRASERRWQTTSMYKKLKSFVLRKIMFHSFKNAAGLIFLIDGEYEKFQEITHVSNQNFVAPMPGDPAKKIDYSMFRHSRQYQQEKTRNSISVIVGNSATPTNHHEEVFIMLASLMQSKNAKTSKDLKVFTPLSYGIDEYRDKIIECGNAILGEEIFYPIVDFMPQANYFQFLSGLDIGIFYNDRQQAMGNINMLLAMGKKVFLRPGTSMWNNFRKQGYSVFSAEEIRYMNIDEFYYFDEKARKSNMLISDGIDKIERAKVAWNTVFNNTLEKTGGGGT